MVSALLRYFVHLGYKASLRVILYFFVMFYDFRLAVVVGRS